MMRAILPCFLVLFLCLVGASSRHLDLHNQYTSHTHNSMLPNKVEKKMLMEEARANKEIDKMGSRPPSCERKCYECTPCEAIQVPTLAGRVGVQYTNYEPEGWKCKCGPTFYSP